MFTKTIAFLTCLTVIPLSVHANLKQETKAKNTVSLTVVVNDLRNSKGVVQFSLYNKTGSIPDERYIKTFKQLKGTINSKSSNVTFKDLPKGIYAINILHDENKNGRIDKGFFLPIEGIGFSQFSSINITNKPSFKKASFNLDSNSTKSIHVIYF